MKRTVAIWVLAAGAVLIAGCAGETDPAGYDDDAGATEEQAPAAPAEAVALIGDTAGGALSGEARFRAAGDQVTVIVKIENAPPGKHAFHIHENGSCGDRGSAAGGHWNPTGMDHGKWGSEPFHLGDIGNIAVGEDGKGSLSLTTDRWSIGSGAENDILNKAVILHETVDDFTSQPTGNAGGRIGCGVIE